MHFYGCGYNGDKDKPGIWLFDLDEGLVGECGGVANPSFGTFGEAAASKTQSTDLCERRMYFACEEEDCARIAFFSIGKDGTPRMADERSFEGANGTCYVLVDKEGRCVYGADYNSGSICQCALNADGAFGSSWPLVQHAGHGPKRDAADPDFDRQLGPHVHTLSFVPGTSYIAAVDLGLDVISIYNPLPDGRISTDTLVGEVHVPEGCGPRIVAYHPALPMAAVVCELSCEVLLYAIDKDGTKWTLLERHGLINGHAADWKRPDAHDGIPEDEYPPLSAHAEFSKDGRFLYVSTRGTNTITVFNCDPGGKAAFQSAISSGGHSPRHFAISPDQRYIAVANQVSNEITLFERNEETGKLTQLKSFACNQPSCVIWV